MTKKTAAISARVSEETKQRLNAYADKVEKKATDIIETAIHYYLDTQEDVATQNETHIEDNAIQNEIQENENVTQNETQLLEQRLKALEDEVKKLRIDANGNADKLNQLNQNAVTIPDMEGISCNIATVEERKTQTPTDNNWEALNQKELAARLGKVSSALTEARKRGNFSEWSKHHDPDGISWEYGADKKYYPQSKD